MPGTGVVPGIFLDYSSVFRQNNLFESHELLLRIFVNAASSKRFIPFPYDMSADDFIAAEQRAGSVHRYGLGSYRSNIGNRLKDKDPANDRVFVFILLRGKAVFPYAEAAVRGKTMR